MLCGLSVTPPIFVDSSFGLSTTYTSLTPSSCATLEYTDCGVPCAFAATDCCRRRRKSARLSNSLPGMAGRGLLTRSSPVIVLTGRFTVLAAADTTPAAVKIPVPLPPSKIEDSSLNIHCTPSVSNTAKPLGMIVPARPINSHSTDESPAFFRSKK